MLTGNMLTGNMLKRLLRDESASVLLEFAICLPVLITVYIGSYTVSDIAACNRKLSVAARTLTDLVSRGLSPSAVTSNPTGTDASFYMSAAVVTLTPYGRGSATEQVALLRICDSSHAYVVWSQAQTQTDQGTATKATPALTAGSLSATSVVNVPSSMITSPMVPTSPDGSDICTNYSAGTAQTVQLGTAGGYLFVSEVDYTYTPLAGFGFATSIPLGYSLYMSPRLI
jgi:Flp pilus assembly protein TadG